jgi:hypothetical protein
VQNIAILNLEQNFSMSSASSSSSCWGHLPLHSLADRTDRRPPPPVPQNPDAMEVAFLQGGVSQVIER